MLVPLSADTSLLLQSRLTKQMLMTLVNSSGFVGTQCSSQIVHTHL